MAAPPSGSDPRFDDEALAALDAVYRFAVHLTRDTTDADDLVQETYAKAYAHRAQYTLGTNCAAWLCTICRNLFLRQKARVDREPAVADPDLEALASAAVFVAAQGYGLDDTAFERPDFRDALQRALRRLPDAYRSAVILVDLEDMNYADAAAVLGVPIGTLRSRLFRGRRLMQQDLVQFAVDAGVVDIPSGESP